MTSATQQTFIANESLGYVMRPGRALIGWMADDKACLILASRRSDLADAEEFRTRSENARAAVHGRPAFEKDANVVLDADTSLSDYIDAFIAQPDFRPFAAEGWTVKVADLRKVCALQPMVHWDYSKERTQQALPDNILSIAPITLPINSEPDKLPVQFDEARNTWTVTSRNPNLRVVGNFSGPVKTEDGRTVFGCGFGLAVNPSFVQVARSRGRYILRDGYHRSIGLLSRGITHAPVLFRDYGEYESLRMSKGMLTEAAYLWERPPFLPDYFAEDVSAEIQAPASQRVIVIQGSEMSLLG
jgi:hypothetical protein